MINGRYFSYLNTAAEIIKSYQGVFPFSEFLKSFFRAHKKAGSKDRKWIASLCYGYMRLGKAIPNADLNERIVTGYFLCNTEKNDLIETLAPEWAAHAEASVNSKLIIIREKFPDFTLDSIFPFLSGISTGLDTRSFLLALLRQPDIFIRIRPGHVSSVHRKLKRADISYNPIDEYAVKLPAGSPLDKVLELQNELVIQDLSSQRCSEFFPSPDFFPGPVKIWDCCAASGGKSILVCDYYKNIQLTVSDNRPAILDQLKARFTEAKIENYLSFNLDLSQPVPATKSESEIPQKYFDLVMADVPCSGSGTWARTPERMLQITKSSISELAELQFQIANNVIRHVRHGGYFLYITCSVYKEENEDMVTKISEVEKMKLIKSGLIQGTANGADTLFAALFISGS